MEVEFELKEEVLYC